MAVKRRKTIRTTQPSGPVPLDPYWLKRGLVLYDVGNGWIWTKKGGWQGTSSRVGPPRLQTTAKYGAVKGYGPTYGVGTTDRTDGPSLDPASGIRSWLLFSYANGYGGGNLGRIMQPAGKAGNTIGDESWYISSASSYEILYQRVTDAANGAWAISGAPVLSAWVGYGSTHDQRTVGNTPAMYKNGAVVSTSVVAASTGNYQTASITLDIGNRSTDGIRGWDGMLGPKLIFDHPISGLSAAEHKLLFENPHRVALMASRRNTATSGVTLTPSLFTNSASFYAATVGVGAVDLTPSLVTNSNSFYAATVSQGDFNLTPSLVTNASTFYAATVTTGSVGLTPSLFTNTNSFYAPTVILVVEFHDDHERGNINISASSIDQDYYAPTIRIYPRLQVSENVPGTPGYEVFHARVTGLLGKRPNWKVRYYETPSTTILDRWFFQSTQRFMWSYDAVTWNYFDTHALSGDNLNIDFKENADFTSDTVWVCSIRPYTGTMTAALVSSLASTYSSYVSMPPSSAGLSYVSDTMGTQTDERGRTIPAQPLYSLRISDDTQQPADGSAKRVAVMIAGQHASEDVGNWMLQGAVEFLCGTDPKAIAARKNFEWFIYPMTNPMGRYGGHWRGDFNSVNPTYDTNRHWVTTPGIESTTKTMAAITTDLGTKNVAAFFDFHGGYSGNFIYSGSPFYSTFLTKMLVYTAGITTFGDNPVDSSCYWANGTRKAPLATFIESSRDLTWTETQTKDYGATVIKSVSDLFADGAWPAVLPGLVTNTSTFHAPTVSVGAVDLTPSLVTNSTTFYGATITVGFLLAPDLFTNAPVFYAAAITVGGVTVAPGLFSNAQLFHVPTVGAGSVDLTPSLVSNTNTFHSPTVTDAGAILLPNILSNLNVFYSATVSTGSVALLPGLFSNSTTFYAHSLGGGASVRNFVNDVSVLSVPVSQYLSVLSAPSGADIYVQ